MSSRSRLTPEFLISCNIHPSRNLVEWLHRASYILATRPSAEDKLRYEYWALGLIERAVQLGGVDAIDWKTTPPSMPRELVHSEIPVPRMLSPATTSATAATATKRYHEYGGSKRQQLLDEALFRMPGELKAWVPEAFAKLDELVGRGQLSYDSLSFVEVLRVTEALQKQNSAVPQRRGYVSPTAAASYASPSAAPLQPAAAAAATGLRASISADYYPPPAPSPYMVATSQSSTVSRPLFHTSTYMPQPPVLPPPPQYVSSAPPVQQRKRPRSPSPPTVSARHDSVVQHCLSLLHKQDEARRHGNSFIGESTMLERMYSRDEPTPADIRPESFLPRAFEFVLQKSKNSFSDPAKGAKYLADQLKGMRQDLTVQHIRSPFTVKVYETNARVCLELRDLGDFNQCQAGLRSLYTVVSPSCAATVDEFVGYRLLYLALGGQYDSLSVELTLLHGNDARVDPTVLQLCAAVQDGDSGRLFRLLHDFPTEGMKQLVRIFLQRQRVSWLADIATACRGKLSLRFLLHTLGFLPRCPTTSPAAALSSSSTSALRKLLESPSALLSERAFEVLGYWFPDGSASQAEHELKELFQAIKFTLPESFSLADEMTASAQSAAATYLERSAAPAEKKKSKSADVKALIARYHASPKPEEVSVEAADLKQAVAAYIDFLRTRKDANIERSDD